MTRPLSLFFTALLVALMSAALSGPATNLPLQVGTTAAVKKEVVGKFEHSARLLRQGDDVHQNELIVTSSDSEGEFVLRDNTKLALGPNSQITLDRFVYDPDAKDGDIVINATKGAFRFITGSAKKSAYTIKTPVASIGIRGTVFDGYVNDDGEIAVLLMEGEVNVCNSGRECRRLNRKGYFLHVGRRGTLGKIRKWDGTFMKGVGLERAFPFVGRRLKIDRVRRFKRADLMGKALRANAPGRALKANTPARALRTDLPGRVKAKPRGRSFGDRRPVGSRSMRNLNRAAPRIRAPQIGGFGR